MAATMLFAVENRLAKAVQSETGPRICDLVAAADRRLETMSESTRRFVAGKLDELAPYAGASNDTLLGEFGVIARIASHIAGVADAGGLKAIGAITQGIVAMADSWASDGLWHAGALRLHLDSLGLASSVGGELRDQDQKVLDGLRAMRMAIGVRE
ncbi:MAG: hypothetical protein Q8L66_07270 [Caulobacter sp.]|nr:hypothetical protein [Caulobacter sp.]